jgi:hypothetical protein
MRVVDTSVRIEWLIGGPLHKTLMKEFPEKAQCVVPTIVQLELSKWLVREVGEEKSDRGSPMRAKSTAELLVDFGVAASFSRPRVSNDNPFSEAQFKTLKYRPDFPERFDSIDQKQS